MDDNELIAGFMGGWNESNYTKHLGMNLPTDGNPHWEDQWYDYKDMKYSTSWDWIMSVVKKITPLAIKSGQQAWFDTKYFLLDGNIKVIHERVVEFIKWYNQQKQ